MSGRDPLEVFDTAVADPLARRSPLGVRFLDLHLGRPVTDGLDVALRSDGGRGIERRPVLGPSGVFSFHGVPGLLRWEAMTEDASSPPGSYALRVRDRRGRYLPHALLVGLPRDEPLTDIPLFVAPAYAPPPGWAAVRGRVAEWSGADPPPPPEEAPAAWARVEVALEGSTVGEGVSDARGEFLVVFPYPDLLDVEDGVTSPPASASPPSSPPGAGGGSRILEDRSWPLEVRVAYDPGARTTVPGTDLPSLRSIRSQGARQVVTVWTEDRGPDLGDALQAGIAYGSLGRIATSGRQALWVHVP